MPHTIFVALKIIVIAGLALVWAPYSVVLVIAFGYTAIEILQIVYTHGLPIPLAKRAFKKRHAHMCAKLNRANRRIHFLENEYARILESQNINPCDFSIHLARNALQHALKQNLDVENRGIIESALKLVVLQENIAVKIDETKLRSRDYAAMERRD